MRHTIKQLLSIKWCEMSCPSTLAQTNYDSVQNPGWFFDIGAHNYTTQFFRGLFHKPIFQDPYKPINQSVIRVWFTLLTWTNRCEQKTTEVSSQSRCVLRMFSQVSRGDAMLMVEWDPVGNCRLLTWQNCWKLTMGRRDGGKSWGKE